MIGITMDRVTTSSSSITRRLLGGLALCAAVGLLAGCLPPAPNHQPAPTVISADVTPVVPAGESVTAVVRTFHPVGVYRMFVSVRGPLGAHLDPDDPAGCSSQHELRVVVTPTPGQEAETSASCSMPAFANNGTWTMTLQLEAQDHLPTTVTVPFEVVGGVDDPGPPVVTTVIAPPSTIVAGQGFPVSFRVEDVNLPPDVRLAWRHFLRRTGPDATPAAFSCVDHVVTWQGPHVAEISMWCPVPLGTPLGMYRSGFGEVVDQLQLRGEVTEVEVTVVPG